MKAFFSKIWTWIKSTATKVWEWSVAHKAIAITTAAVVVAGTSCAIVLPIALHEHSYATEWSSDADNHWHDATCKHEEEKSDLAAHTYTNACDTTCDVCGYTRTVGAHVYDNACDTTCNVCGATRTVEPHVYDNACDTACNVCGATRTVEPHVYDNACDTTCNVCGATRTITHDHAETLTEGETTHWYACSVCGDKKDEAAHVFDKTVASSEYLKAAATATTKAQYYKSCVCGAKSATEYFETDKTAGTLANIQDLSKTYDKVELVNPTYETNSDGAVTIEWYQGGTKLDSKPVNAGTYKVKVIIAESATYTGISAEKEFTIAKKVLSGLSVDLTYAGTNSFEVPLGAANGILAGDVADGIKVCITFANKNVGAAVTGAGLDADDGDNYTNYELDLTTCTANIVKRPVWAENVKFTYDGTTVWTGEESPKQIVFQNMANGESMDSSFVKWTFDSKDVGATLASVTFVDEDDGRSNYVIDFSKCTASIEKRIIGNLDLSFEYNGESYFEITYTRANLSEIVTGDTVRFEIGTTEADAGVYTIANGKLEEIVVDGDGRVGFNYEVDVETCKVTVTPIEMSFDLSNVAYNGTDEFKRGHTSLGGDLEYRIQFIYSLHANGGDGTLLKNAGEYTDVKIESYQVYDVDEDNNIIRVTPNFVLSEETLQQVVPNFRINRMELFEGISLTTVYNGEKGRTGLTNATIEEGTCGEDELTLSISGNTAWNVGTINLYSQEQLDQTGFVPVAPYEIVTIVGEAAANYFMLDADTSLVGPVGTIEVTPKVLNVSKTFEYEGSAADGRQLHESDASLSGVIDGDELFIQIWFESGNAGALVLTGEDAPYLDGADCDNYTLGTYSFSIAPKKLTLKAGETISVNKDYNGNTDYTIPVSSDMFDGYVDTEAAGLWLTAKLPSKNVGTYTDDVVLVPYVGNSALGTVSHNYDFSEVEATVTVKPLTVSLSSYVKVEYNGTCEFTLTTPFDLTSANTGGGQDSVLDSDEVYITWIETGSKAVTDETFAIDYTLGGADAGNYEIDELGVEITKKKLTNLHLCITDTTYATGEITLTAEDGIVAGESVKISITNFNTQDFGTGFEIFMELADGTAPDAYRYETVALVESGDYANYELATYENEDGYQVVGILEGVTD